MKLTPKEELAINLAMEIGNSQRIIGDLKKSIVKHSRLIKKNRRLLNRLVKEGLENECNKF